MPREYTISFTDVAVAAVQDLFEVLPATQKPVEFVALRLAQHTEVAANVGEDEFLRVAIVRGNTTSGSGGTTATARPLDSNATAAGLTAEVNNTTQASAGPAVTIADMTFNIRVGLLEVFPPEMRPRVQNSNVMVVRLRAAPADSITMSGTLWVREL